MSVSEFLKQSCIDGVTYQLVTPSARFEPSYREYIAELGDEERYPFVLDLDASDFSHYLDRLEAFRLGVDLPKGYVDSATFWLVRGNTLLGVSNLRQRLNAEIAHVGGHIGLGIRPSARGKGLSTLLLRWTCEIAKSRHIGHANNSQLHVHCYFDNHASQNMIKSVGGVLDSTIEVGDIKVARFIIEI